MTQTANDGETTPRWTRPVVAVGVFTVGYLLVSALVARQQGNHEFIFYGVVMGLLIAAVAGIHARVGYTLPLLICLSAWGAMHMAGGLVPVPESWPIHGEQRVLYSWWLIPGGLKYDQVVHALGFGVATWACWQGLKAAAGLARPTVGTVALCVLGGLGLGAGNEVVEFIATRLNEETNVGGYVNTGWDLVANTVGAVGAGVAIYVVGCRRV